MTYIRIPDDSSGNSGGGGSGGPAFWQGDAGGGNPPSSVGVDGDVYLDTSNGTLWLRAGGEYGTVAFSIPALGGPPYRYQNPGVATWSQASTAVATVPSNFNNNTVSYGLAFTAIVAYNAQGTQPANFSLGVNGSATNVLSSRSLSGMGPTTCAIFTPSGAVPLATPGSTITIAPVGGAVSGGGLCSFDLIGMLR